MKRYENVFSSQTRLTKYYNHEITKVLRSADGIGREAVPA